MQSLVKLFINGHFQLPIADINTTLLEATAQVRATQTPVIASFTYHVPLYDPLAMYAAVRQLTPYQATYWEVSSQQVAFVGMGSAYEIVTSGNEAIQSATVCWREMMHNAVIHHTADVDDAVAQPVCIGGFAFDPTADHSADWHHYPDGLLVLPQVLFRVSATEMTITCNTLVTMTTTVAASTGLLADMLAQVEAAVTQLPPVDVSAPRLAVAMTSSRTTWLPLVHTATQTIANSSLEKVVLARSVTATTTTPYDVIEALQRLRQLYPAAYIFAFQREDTTFMGATPERLVAVDQQQMQTMALAGSAPRGVTPEADAQLGLALIDSTKNRHEHAIVTAEIRQSLAPLTDSLTIPATPSLLQLANVQHLQTKITGELLPDRTILDVVAALHPTPAV